MGNKRRSDADNAGGGLAEPVNGDSREEECDSDFSLHLPESIFGSHENGSSKKKSKEKRLSKALPMHDGPSSSNQFVTEQEEGPSEPAFEKTRTLNDSRFAVYLIRKPIELSPEDLSGAHIPVDSCSAREKRITINDKRFTIRSVDSPVQMFHIPAEIIHSSEKSRFKGIDKQICGTVVITRADFDQTPDLVNGDRKTSHESLTDLPLKVIKKKVSRKGLRNLRQRLKANGVKYDRNMEDSSQNEATSV